MSADLHDLLDDLASDATVAPGLADRAWQAGSARAGARRLRLAGVAAALVGVLALLLPSAGVAVPALGPARGETAGVQGHPERIGRQWWVRELPDRPGPVAALLQASRRDGEQPDWYAVRADGHRFHLPEVSHQTDQYPSLSRDGRRVGYLQTEEGPYVVHDLVTGERTSFEGIGDNRETTRARFRVQGQAPAHWSPDGRRVALTVIGGALLLDVTTGEVELLPRGERGLVTGWRAEDRLVWLTPGPGSGAGAVSGVRAVTTDLRSRTVADVVLAGAAPSVLSQWAGVVSDDGRRLAVVSDGTFDSVTGVQLFDLTSGQALGALTPVEVWQPCASTWGDRLVVPARVGQRLTTVDLGTLEPLTAVTPSLFPLCLLWATDAVDGPAGGGGLLGSTDAWWAWWWKEVLIGAAAVLGVGAERVRRARATKLSARG